MMNRLFNTKYPAFIILVSVCIYFLLSGCNKKHKDYKSPQGYKLDKPVKWELGRVLTEISGLSYIKDDRLVAISDSKKKVFEINITKRKLKDFTGDFAEKDNYEDLVLLDSTVFVLANSGTIRAVPEGAKDSSTTQVYPFWSSEKNDFETLYYDPTANGLIMICKTCAHEKKQEIRTAYRFDLARRQFDSTSFYVIDEEKVKQIVQDTTAKFKPSGAAIHPIDKRLYILSSAGQLLVIADTHGNVKEVYNLDPNLFPQAEGIAFAANGDLYISNEGKYGRPTLLIFPYNKKDTRQK